MVTGIDSARFLNTTIQKTQRVKIANDFDAAARSRLEILLREQIIYKNSTYGQARLHLWDGLSDFLGRIESCLKIFSGWDLYIEGPAVLHVRYDTLLSQVHMGVCISQSGVDVQVLFEAVKDSLGKDFDGFEVPWAWIKESERCGALHLQVLPLPIILNLRVGEKRVPCISSYDAYRIGYQKGVFSLSVAPGYNLEEVLRLESLRLFDVSPLDKIQETKSGLFLYSDMLTKGFVPAFKQIEKGYVEVFYRDYSEGVSKFLEDFYQFLQQIPQSHQLLLILNLEDVLAHSDEGKRQPFCSALRAMIPDWEEAQGEIFARYALPKSKRWDPDPEGGRVSSRYLFQVEAGWLFIHPPSSALGQLIVQNGYAASLRALKWRPHFSEKVWDTALEQYAGSVLFDYCVFLATNTVAQDGKLEETLLRKVPSLEEVHIYMKEFKEPHRGVFLSHLTGVLSRSNKEAAHLLIAAIHPVPIDQEELEIPEEVVERGALPQFKHVAQWRKWLTEQPLETFSDLDREEILQRILGNNFSEESLTRASLLLQKAPKWQEKVEEVLVGLKFPQKNASSLLTNIVAFLQKQHLGNWSRLIQQLRTLVAPKTYPIDLKLQVVALEPEHSSDLIKKIMGRLIGDCHFERAGKVASQYYKYFEINSSDLPLILPFLDEGAAVYIFNRCKQPLSPQLLPIFTRFLNNEGWYLFKSAFIKSPSQTGSGVAQEILSWQVDGTPEGKILLEKALGYLHQIPPPKKQEKPHLLDLFQSFVLGKNWNLLTNEQLYPLLDKLSEKDRAYCGFLRKIFERAQKDPIRLEALHEYLRSGETPSEKQVARDWVVLKSEVGQRRGDFHLDSVEIEQMIALAKGGSEPFFRAVSERIKQHIQTLDQVQECEIVFSQGIQGKVLLLCDVPLILKFIMDKWGEQERFQVYSRYRDLLAKVAAKSPLQLVLFCLQAYRDTGKKGEILMDALFLFYEKVLDETSINTRDAAICCLQLLMDMVEHAQAYPEDTFNNALITYASVFFRKLFNPMHGFGSDLPLHLPRQESIILDIMRKKPEVLRVDKASQPRDVQQLIAILGQAAVKTGNPYVVEFAFQVIHEYQNLRSLPQEKQAEVSRKPADPKEKALFNNLWQNSNFPSLFLAFYQEFMLDEDVILNSLAKIMALKIPEKKKTLLLMLEPLCLSKPPKRIFNALIESYIATSSLFKPFQYRGIVEAILSFDLNHYEQPYEAVKLVLKMVEQSKQLLGSDQGLRGALIGFMCTHWPSLGDQPLCEMVEEIYRRTNPNSLWSAEEFEGLILRLSSLKPSRYDSQCYLLAYLNTTLAAERVNLYTPALMLGKGYVIEQLKAPLLWKNCFKEAFNLVAQYGNHALLKQTISKGFYSYAVAVLQSPEGVKAVKELEEEVLLGLKQRAIALRYLILVTHALTKQRGSFTSQEAENFYRQVKTEVQRGSKGEPFYEVVFEQSLYSADPQLGAIHLKCAFEIALGLHKKWREGAHDDFMLARLHLLEDLIEQAERCHQGSEFGIAACTWFSMLIEGDCVGVFDTPVTGKLPIEEFLRYILTKQQFSPHVAGQSNSWLEALLIRLKSLKNKTQDFEREIEKLEGAFLSAQGYWHSPFRSVFKKIFSKKKEGWIEEINHYFGTLAEENKEKGFAVLETFVIRSRGQLPLREWIPLLEKINQIHPQFLPPYYRIIENFSFQYGTKNEYQLLWNWIQKKPQDNPLIEPRVHLMGVLGLINDWNQEKGELLKHIPKEVRSTLYAALLIQCARVHQDPQDPQYNTVKSGIQTVFLSQNEFDLFEISDLIDLFVLYSSKYKEQKTVDFVYQQFIRRIESRQVTDPEYFPEEEKLLLHLTRFLGGQPIDEALQTAREMVDKAGKGPNIPFSSALCLHLLANRLIKENRRSEAQVMIDGIATCSEWEGAKTLKGAEEDPLVFLERARCSSPLGRLGVPLPSLKELQELLGFLRN